MTDQVREFYKTLAANYHYIFADWNASIQRQGDLLDRLLRTQLGEGPHRVLDCACGIGTQAIGLALRGYRVHATDLSAEAVERARQEAQQLGANLTFDVADFRELGAVVSGTFDAVIAFDNAIAHLQTASDLEQALNSMAAKVAPGGTLMVSLRDYDQIVQEKPRTNLPVVKDNPEGRTVVFQVWDWNEDFTAYQLSHFTVKQQGDSWETVCAVSQLRAWQRAEVSAALKTTGLSAIEWLMPDASGFYQPIILARKLG